MSEAQFSGVKVKDPPLAEAVGGAEQVSKRNEKGKDGKKRKRTYWSRCRHP